MKILVIKLFQFGGASLENIFSENPVLEKVLSSHLCFKNSPLNIRDAFYGGRNEAKKHITEWSRGKI